MDSEEILSLPKHAQKQNQPLRQRINYEDFHENEQCGRVGSQPTRARILQ